MPTPPQEVQFRKKRYLQLKHQHQARLDEGTAGDRRIAKLPEFLEIKAQFLESQDLELFKKQMDACSRNGEIGFAGPAGQMLLNQLINDSEPEEITPLINRLLTVPENDKHAEQLIDDLTVHVDKIRTEGSFAARGSLHLFASWFWWMQDDNQKWPMVWHSSASIFRSNGYLPKYSNEDVWQIFVDHRQILLELEEDWEEVAQILAEVYDNKSHGIDISIPARLSELRRQSMGEANEINIHVLEKGAKTLGKNLEGKIEEIFSRDVKVAVEKLTEGNGPKILKIFWEPKTEQPSPALALTVQGNTVKIGLYGQAKHPGLNQQCYETLKDVKVDGRNPWMPLDSEIKDLDGHSLKILGKQFELEALTNAEDLETAVMEVADVLLPVFENFWASEVDTKLGKPTIIENSELLALVERFRTERGYPTEADNRDVQKQQTWQKLLAKDKLAAIPLSELRKIYGGSLYGSTGPQSILHTTLKDEEPEVIERFLKAIDHLLWNTTEETATRIDRVLDEDDLGLRGFKETAIMKFLAVSNPKKYLTTYSLNGNYGKARMLAELNQPAPEMSLSIGERHITSNDALQQLLEPYFGNDSFAKSRFLYWLIEDEAQKTTSTTAEQVIDPVEAAAEELYLPKPFVQDIVDLLEEHKQVIFYGPPGTGKTYVAQHLAEHLTKTAAQTTLIQFHPAYSYEDFFEGYRPETSPDGNLTYKLTEGSLRKICEKATQDPDNPYILIIDEINRANLSKVLGELMFLLEYRNKDIQPLYRDEPFRLPKNLRIIGTMNTADRSIASVDTALRRRFKFVQFSPDSGTNSPISEMFSRWAEDNTAPEWLIEFVEVVNTKLKEEMGGNHMLLGPSYFMKRGINQHKLEKIWQYQIEPLIEDLFFGADIAKEFKFDKLWKDFHGPDEEY